MKPNFSRILGKEPQRTVIYLTSLLLVKAGMQIALYQKGFISVSADEFARGIRAATWAENPHINILADIQGTWLPVEKYLNGLFLLLWPDVILAPRVTVFIASTLLLIVIYLLAKYLFDSFAVAALTTLHMIFLPWYVWLSGTPMLEMYYFSCFFAGLLFIIVWLKEARRGYWFWAASCFLLASGFHVQSWIFINLVNLLTLPYLYGFLQQRKYADLVKLIAFYVLSNGLIISFALIEFVETGTAFAFLATHTSYSRWFYDGYNVSLFEKLLYYPRLVIQHSSSVTWVCVAVALAFLRRDRQRQWKLFPLLLGILALLVNSAMNVFSGPPSAAPARYSLFYVLLLSLYVAYGVYHLFQWGWQRAPQLIRVPAAAIAIFLFLYSIGWGAGRIPNYPRGMPLDAVAVGRNLNALLDENPGTYMVELRYWEFLAVNLTARHYDKIIFDRERNTRDRNTPSIFLRETARVCHNLATLPALRYIVLQNEQLKFQAQQIRFLRLVQHIGSWTIYEVIPAANNACG